MKLFAFSDWRGHPLEPIRNAIEREKPDAVLYLGDDLDNLVSVNPDPPLYHFYDGNWRRWTERKIVFHPDWDEKEAKRIMSYTLATQGIDAVLSLSENNRALIESRGLNVGKFTHEIETALDEYLRGVGHVIELGKIFTDNALLERENKDGFFASLEIPVFFVNGNDKPMLYEKGVWYLATHVRHVGHWGLLPICESPTIGFTTFNKNEESVSLFGLYASWGMKSTPLNLPDRYADIILSHVPPFGCLDFSVRFGKEHIGSRRLRDSIEHFSPKIVLCGHSHLSGGQIERLNETTIVNISVHDSPRSPGHYALITTTDWSVKLKNLNDRT